MDWKTNNYAPQKSWDAMKSETFNQRYPEGKAGGRSIALAIVAVPLSLAAVAGLVYSVLTFFGS